MGYCERGLRTSEYSLALSMRMIPREERLEACQEVCNIAEYVRDKAHGSVSQEVWDSMHFPRYRFFNVAMPNQGWLQYAENPNEAIREKLWGN